MPLNEKKVEVYRVMGDVVAKFILAIAAAGVFIMISIALVRNPRWELAVADSFFGGTLFYVFRHYFPSAAATKETRKIQKAGPKKGRPET
ncbi:MAG TPA: hypothetical protein VGM86_16700 [Thermoanaerobaculia bacterium]|jgi:hypothetical protein